MTVRHQGQTQVNQRKAYSTPKRRKDAAADNGKSETMCLSLQTLNTANRGVMQSPLSTPLLSLLCLRQYWEMLSHKFLPAVRGLWGY